MRDRNERHRYNTVETEWVRHSSSKGSLCRTNIKRMPPILSLIKYGESVMILQSKYIYVFFLFILLSKKVNNINRAREDEELRRVRV